MAGMRVAYIQNHITNVHAMRASTGAIIRSSSAGFLD
jgi:hypothetical protein